MKKVIKIKDLTLNPLSIFQKIEGVKKCLLESTSRNESKNHFSVIAFNPVRELRYQAGIFFDGEKNYPCEDPLKEVEKQVRKVDEVIADYPFQGGAIGYVSYDMAGCYEEICTPKEDELMLPDLLFYLYETFVIYDHTKKETILIYSNAYTKKNEDQMIETLEAIKKQLLMSGKTTTPPTLTENFSYTSVTTQGEFEGKVSEAKELIKAGDIFQIVLSQRFKVAFNCDPFTYYCALRKSNPSSYMYFLEFEQFQVVGSSPESLVSVRNGEVITNPIAGTRKRGSSQVEDEKLEQELLADPKEKAEHLMLVDLGRNDLQKVSAINSVRVPIYMQVEKYRYVMHLVSLVKGTLKKETTAMDALKATMPAGTVSGAPKIRAMNRIYEFETQKRGIYAGAIGYYSLDEQADFAIAIRTMVIKEGIGYVQAGAGIVADSQPTSEYFETIHKAKALLEVCQ